MLYFHRERLVFLEVPKTGSSAVAHALRGFATIEVHDPPHLRHMNIGTFNARARNHLKTAFPWQVETAAVMREPVDRLVSWYRYLQRPPVPGAPDSTTGMEFADFVAAVLADDPRFEGIGRQDRFLMDDHDRPQVTHVFQYDRQDILAAFLTDRFAMPISFSRVNVSRAAPVEVPDELRDKVTRARPREAALWRQVSARGHLHTLGV